MKKLSLMAVITALLSVFTFSSCLNSDNYESYDFYNAFVTVKSDYMGSPYLIGDISNIKFYPTSSSVLASLKKSDGSYYNRVVVSIKMAEGETAPGNGGSCKISEIALTGGLLTQSMTTQPDSLKGDYSFISIASQDNYGMVWAGNGYINVPFSYYINNSDNIWNFQLYVTDAKQDTLYTKLRRTSETKLQSSTSNAMISYKIPNDYDTQELINELVPNKDSIIVKVTAVGPDGKEISKSSDKVNYLNLY